MASTWSRETSRGVPDTGGSEGATGCCGRRETMRQGAAVPRHAATNAPVRRFSWDTWSWDARVIWFFHAKRIYLDNDILAQLDGYIPATHNDYPVLVPAVAASIARSVGYWNEVVPRLAVLTILFPTLAFIAVRINRTNHVLAWLTGVLVIANKLLLNGYMDALLALAVASLGIAYMELQRERPPPRPADRWTLIVLIVLLTMALPHLKNEGMLAVVALGISMGIRSSQGAVPVVASSIAGIGYVAGWRMHVASHGLETDLFAPGIAARAMDRLGDPWALLLIGAWFAIHAGPACVVLVACARTRRAGLPIAEPWVRSIAFVGIYALGMAAISLTTPNELAWHLETSARVTVHGVSWERATGDWSCHARCSLKAAWDQAEAGRSWGTAWPAMLAVQTSAR